MKIGINPYHEKLATIGSMKEIPMEIKKKIGVIMLRIVENLIAVFFIFFSIM